MSLTDWVCNRAGRVLVGSALPAFLFAQFFAVFDAFYQYFRGVLIPVLVPQDGVKTEQLSALQRVACCGADRDRNDYRLLLWGNWEETLS